MSHRILVVDDDREIRDLLRTLFAKQGFQVATASTARQFRGTVLDFKPDVIILDIMLTDEDGVEVYEAMLAKGLSRDIPVIFLSALAQDRPPQFPQADHTYSLVGKPFDGGKLVRKVKALLDDPAGKIQRS